MAAWLENSDESDDLEVWDMQKNEYGFKDLISWLNNGGILLEAEGKVEKKEKKIGRKG